MKSWLTVDYTGEVRDRESFVARPAGDRRPSHVILPNGEAVLENVYLEPSQTIDVLKQQVSSILGGRMHRLVSSAGVLLHPDDTIESCGLADEHTVTAVAYEGLRLTVKSLKNDTFEVEADTQQTVRELKDLIEKYHPEFPADMLKIVHRGQILAENDATLSSCDLKAGDVIVVHGYYCRLWRASDEEGCSESFTQLIY